MMKELMMQFFLQVKGSQQIKNQYGSTPLALTPWPVYSDSLCSRIF